MHEASSLNAYPPDRYLLPVTLQQFRHAVGCLYAHAAGTAAPNGRERGRPRARAHQGSPHGSSNSSKYRLSTSHKHPGSPPPDLPTLVHTWQSGSKCSWPWAAMASN